MIKKSLVLCALATLALPSLAFASGISLVQSSGTSSEVYYIPTAPVGFGPGEVTMAVFRPDGSLLDMIYDSHGFECTPNTGYGTSTSGYVDISSDINTVTCEIQGQNPYGIYTFVEAPGGHIDNCDWGQLDSHGHISPLPDLQACIESAGPSATYTTYDWLPPDVIPPHISSSTSITIEATSSLGALVSYLQPTAIDDRDGVVSVACNPVSGSLFLLGTTTVACGASDSAGNTATSSFNVIVNYAPPAAKKPKDDCDIAIPLPGSSKVCISLPVPKVPKTPKLPTPPKPPKLPKLPK